jgi:flagellar M-ring protein FliF
MEAMVADAPAPEEPAGADVMEIHTERGMELRKDIRKFVEENPEIAAQMIKIWLRGGENNNA